MGYSRSGEISCPSKNVDALIMVYDITNYKSFEELKKYWIVQVRENTNEEVIVAIAANKTDLVNEEKVDEGEARKFAKSINSIFISTSAKNIETVKELFAEVGKKYMKCNNITFEAEINSGQSPSNKRRGTYKISKVEGKKKKCC